MCLDEAAKLRVDDPFEDELLMFAILCHDLGKPATTTEASGQIKSIAHEKVGIGPTLKFAEQLKLGHKLRDAVCVLVECHLCPSQFVSQGAKAAAYRRLARKLSQAGTNLVMLERVARADQLGRTTENALLGRFPSGDVFLEKAQSYQVAERADEDVVQGRHLVARGLKPGPNFGKILNTCRVIQDEKGASDPEQVLSEALERHQTSD